MKIGLFTATYLDMKLDQVCKMAADHKPCPSEAWLVRSQSDGTGLLASIGQSPRVWSG